MVFWRLILRGCVAMGVFVTTVAPQHAAEIPDSVYPIVVQKTEFAKTLAEPIADCVTRKDTSHPVFHGCVDWHSAVHAHWALVALNRAVPGITVPRKVRFLFTGDGITKEMEKLEKERRFEMPYGRAWFLRLAIEHMKAGSDGKLIRKHADGVFRSLVAYFERTRVDLFSPNYSSTTWALTNMLDYADETGLTAERKKIQERVERDVDMRNPRCSYRRESGHFMAICTNLALLASRLLDSNDLRQWSNDYLKHVGLPTPVNRPLSWHHHGLNFSRSWGLWELYTGAGIPAIVDAYSEHFLATMKNPVSWKGDYAGVGHWVPQFGVFALQPLFGPEDGRR